jgi:hypothetical protein
MLLPVSLGLFIKKLPKRKPINSLLAFAGGSFEPTKTTFKLFIEPLKAEGASGGSRNDLFDYLNDRGRNYPQKLSEKKRES